jgi:uncharacterized protein
MKNNESGSSVNTIWIDHIPALYLTPDSRYSSPRLIITLPGLSGTKESMVKPVLQDIAAAGCIGLGFDPWQHGERGIENQQQISQRVFGSFRRHFWPILGNTVLDTLRVIDWAIDTLHIVPPVYMVGTSMGGDIAVAAAGLDHRIARVATVVSTADWLRPGMKGKDGPIPQGNADAYARFFYDRFNPLTHLESYAHGPAISFICGEADNHVPADGALRFQKALGEKYPAHADKVKVKLIPGKGHIDFMDPGLWWLESLEWLIRP